MTPRLNPERGRREEAGTRPGGGRQRPAGANSRPAQRPSRSYIVYGANLDAGDGPTLLPPESQESSRPARRREASWTRLRGWLERNGFMTMWNASMRGGDRTLLLIVGILLALGLLMVYSANIGVKTAYSGQTLDRWFTRQVQWAALGIVVLVLFWRVRYTFWRRWSVLMLLGTAVLLVTVMLLGFAPFGLARSLLRNGSIQPAELAKLIMIMYMADWLASKGPKLRQFSFGFVPFITMVGGFGALIVKQKASTALLLVITLAAMFYIAGADVKQIGLMMLLIAIAFGVFTLLADYMWVRFTEFWTAWRNPAEVTELQLRQFMESLQAGGFFGTGLGRGVLKDDLILAHSDGIFAVIGEEFGLLGCIAVIALFAGLGYRGIRIALQMQEGDGYGMLLGFGITTWLVTQALLHIGVVTVTMPPTGIPLPFISYGGTALVTSMAGIGLLLSIACGSEENAGEELRAHSDLWGRDGRPRLSRSGSR